MKHTESNIDHLLMRLKNQSNFIAEYQTKQIEILNYCAPHLDHMWAATIVGIILNCDFKDAKQALHKRRQES